jgi:hypothetical protein
MPLFWLLNLIFLVPILLIPKMGKENSENSSFGNTKLKQSATETKDTNGCLFEKEFYGIRGETVYLSKVTYLVFTGTR